MKAKEFIQLFVPPIYYKVKKRLLPKKKTEYHPLPKVKRDGKRLIIIGNGPSLNQTMELYEKEILGTETMMVNFSARTPLYEHIRPKYYLMMDPNWLVMEGVLYESNKKCVIDIIEKTSWPMYIIMPSSFRDWWAIEEFRKNKNLTILFDESEWRKYPETVLFPAFAENRISPPTCTVLTYGIYLSLYWDYEETYLVGADTTFTHMAYVGQHNNVLYSIDTHYYDNKDVYEENVDPEKHGIPFGMSMEQYLSMCHSIFYEYGLMARYAKWKGLKVYNASEYSMIDCLERKKLS